MIPITKLLYQIDLNLNKVASDQNQFIADEDKILALNRSQLKLIKSKIEGNKIGLGFDAFRTRYEELQDLIVQYEEVSPTKTSEVLPSYQIDLNSLKNKYYQPVDIIALADKGNCKNRQIFVTRIVKHSDLTTLMNNSNYNPNFIYQESLAVISSNKLIVYSGDFTINKILLSYLRFPKEMDIEGYIHLDGTESTNQDCELTEELEDELLNLTIIELGFDISDNNTAQAAQVKQNLP